MQNARTLTDKFVSHASCSDGKSEASFWDSVVPGFGLRVLKSGTKAYFFQGRVNGKTIKVTLGRAFNLKLKDARKAARECVDLTLRGKDPRTYRVVDTHDNGHIGGIRGKTFSAASKEYLERRVRPNLRPSSVVEIERTLNRVFTPKWGERSVRSIDRFEVVRAVDHLATNGSRVAANRHLSHLKTFFKWLAQRGEIDLDVVRDVPMPTKEVSRDRVLSNDELKRLIDGLDKMEWAFGPFYRFLLATAARRGEVAGMRWRDIDLEKRVWTIGSAQNKAGRVTLVPISDFAFSALTTAVEYQASDDGFVFSHCGGETPLSGWSKSKRQLDALSGVSDWRIHDLRRTAATNMAELGVEPHIIAAVLNHFPGTHMGVTSVYNRYSYFEEKRKALSKWSDRLLSLYI